MIPRAGIAVALVAMIGCVPVPEADAPKVAECRVTDIVDGDTFTLACSGQAEQRARLSGVDAPEIATASCAAERERGRVARAHLAELFSRGPISAVRFGEVLSDGRRAVSLDVGGEDLARAMLATGHARPFTDGTYTDWCSQG